MNDLEVEEEDEEEEEEEEEEGEEEEEEEEEIHSEVQLSAKERISAWKSNCRQLLTALTYCRWEECYSAGVYIYIPVCVLELICVLLWQS